MKKSKDGILLIRRDALRLSATAGMGIALTGTGRASDSIKTAAHQEPGNCSTPRSAVANTQYGKVRGFLDGGVYTFKGIPYGQNTGGENRWLPAKPPTPWKDEYPALIYGANCPQNLHNYTSIEQSFLQDWDDGYLSEDMLKLNIWTPSLTGKRWHATLTAALGEGKATELIAAMKKAHPEKAIRTLSYGVQGLSARNNVQRMVKLKYEQGGAPVYQYWFTWQSPMLDGVAGAWHTAELAFCFDNTKRCEQGTGNTPQAQELATRMSTAWANFAATGNPSHPGLQWTPSDPTRVQTMIFDNDCGMAGDPETDVRKILLS